MKLVESPEGGKCYLEYIQCFNHAVLKHYPNDEMLVYYDSGDYFELDDDEILLYIMETI
jgi:hypothetical protein